MDGFWIGIAIVTGVVVYVISNVLQHMRRSREQWKEVDRSKLREWKDDDYW